MRKFIFFPLWKIEKTEHTLAEMEKSGYRLTRVMFSYWFYFQKASPKDIRYFFEYKSFRGKTIPFDYFLLSNHNANIVKNVYCYYSVFRTKATKEEMKLLYDVRLEYIKGVLLENFLISLVLFVLLFPIFLNRICSNQINVFCFLYAFFVVVSFFSSIYYFYGYLFQIRKIKKIK